MAKWIRFDEQRFWCSKCHSFDKEWKTGRGFCSKDDLPDKCPACGAMIEGVKE